MKTFVGILVIIFSANLFSFSAFAKAKDKQNFPPHIARELEKQEQAAASGQDKDLIKAYANQRREHFVEGTGLVVVKVLPDDDDGREHQKWTVRLSNGKLLKAVYNSDICPRVPVQEGDVIAMGGEFIWTQSGGLLHWLHHDPNGKRPAGYVTLNGITYCRD